MLGGGGVLGASQVGMLRALLERGVMPDLVLGTSVGAVNGALIASSPDLETVERLAEFWLTLSSASVFADSPFRQVARMARSRTHLHSSAALRRLLTDELPVTRIEDLTVRFQCVAANIEQARATWFERGSVVDAIVASCSVPGLFPPARIGDAHYFDGGLVESIPLGRAVRLGVSTVYVLQVGRAERPLAPPRWPWEVGLVAFEIARRAHFLDALENAPQATTVHVLPSGQSDTPLVSVRYRSASSVADRIERAHRAAGEYLDSRHSVDSVERGSGAADDSRTRE